jgi:hypothetical protein
MQEKNIFFLHSTWRKDDECTWLIRDFGAVFRIITKIFSSVATMILGKKVHGPYLEVATRSYMQAT